MTRAPIWHGTEDEFRDLQDALQRHCECPSEDGMRTGTCPGHKLMLEQQVLDDLLFARYLAKCLLREEGLIEAEGLVA